MKSILKIVYIAITLVIGLSMMGCGKNSKTTLVEGKVNVVTSFYPLYYFATQIGGEQAHVVNLIAAGVEPHDWTPRSRDLDALSKSQLFFYNGAGLERWVDDFLKGLGADGQLMTVEASRGIELIQGDPEEPREEEQEGSHAHADHEVDPHTWVSPRSAIMMAANVHEAFVKADPAHQAEYDSRYEQLSNALRSLDEKFTERLSGFARRDIVVSHQAFGYLCRDYNLNQIAIMGLSPDAEPRAQDMLAISKFVKEHGIKYIFFEELVSDQLADTLAKEAGIDTLVLNPVEGLTPEQEKAGETYVSMMERNLQNLQKALQ